MQKELVNHRVQSFDSTGIKGELEFIIGSRQPHGHTGDGMTSICLSLSVLPSPRN